MFCRTEGCGGYRGLRLFMFDGRLMCALETVHEHGYGWVLWDQPEGRDAVTRG